MQAYIDISNAHFLRFANLHTLSYHHSIEYGKYNKLKLVKTV